jgi:hypothetical protein
MKDPSKIDELITDAVDKQAEAQVGFAINFLFAIFVALLKLEYTHF